MTDKHPIIAAIQNRRSVAPRRLTAPGPDDEAVRLIISAALAAPDHARLRPWRFLRISDQARDQLATIFAEAARELDSGLVNDALAKEAEKARHGPCLIAAIARIAEDHPVTPVTEQWASVGAAIQNMLLAAEDLGYRAMIVSGKKVKAGRFRQAFGLSDGEHLVGFVAIGTPSAPPSPIERPQVDDYLKDWSGEGQG